MSEQSVGGPVELARLIAPGVPNHAHVGLGSQALNPASSFCFASVDVSGTVHLKDHELGAALSGRARRSRPTIEGELTVKGRLRAARLEGTSPQLWRAPELDRPMVVFNRADGSLSTSGDYPILAEAALPATGPGRLVVLVSWFDQGLRSGARTALQLVLLGPRGGRNEEHLLPAAPSSLTPDERRALATARDFEAWKMARTSAKRGAWLPASSGSDPGHMVNLVCSLPAPRQACRVELVIDHGAPGGEAPWLFQLVFLPSRSP